MKYKNIEIRPLHESDLEYIRIWRNDSNNTYFLSKIPYITNDMQMEWYKNSINRSDEYFFAIDEKNDLNRLVGSFAIYNISGANAEFGKFLIGDTEAHGKHVGVNALLAVCKVCFTYLGLNSIYLNVYVDNVAAIKVYKEVGFCIEKEVNKERGKELIMILTKRNFCMGEGEKYEI